MRFLKLGLISVLLLLVVITAISLMIPSKVTIIRALNMPYSKDSLIRRLSDAGQWHTWNNYVSNPALTGVSASQKEFHSNELNIRIIDIRNDSIITEWHQAKGKTLQSGLVVYGNEVESVVQWYFEIPLKWYPWEKFGSVIFEKQIGPEMERSLQRLQRPL